MTLDTQISEITKRIRNHENGIVAADMERNGIEYHRNFGVSIVHLRKMGELYGTDQALAEALWDKNWRETKILATLVADPNSITMSTLEKWVTECTTQELIEQLSLNLTIEIDEALNLVRIFLAKTETNFICVAATTLAHLAFRKKDVDASALQQFLPTLFIYAEDTTLQTRRSLALAIRRIGRKNKTLNLAATQGTENIISSTNPHTQWLVEDVLVELKDEFIIAGLTD